MDISVFLLYFLYMNNTFSIVFGDDLIQILKSISEAFNVRMSVLDLQMNEVAPLRFQPISRYCRMVQNDLGLLNRCRENDRIYCTKTLAGGSAVSYTCHAGLREAVFPIFIDKEAIGFFIVGQFSTKSAIPDSILSEAERKGRSDEIAGAFAEVSALNPERLDSILKLIDITTQYVIDKRILSLKRNMLSDKLHAFLMEDLTVNPTAEEAASAVNMSVSSVNKALKLAKGTSFRQFSNNLRLEEARKILEHNPQMTVSEVSAKVGIQDPLYFSRIFKRKFSVSPSSIGRETDRSF